MLYSVHGDPPRHNLPRWAVTGSLALMDEFPLLATAHRRSRSGELVWPLQQYARLSNSKGNGMLIRKALKYRLYPTPRQEQTLLFVLRRCRHLYNSALEQRKVFYQMRRKSLGYTQQAAELAEIKAAYPAYQDI